MSTLREGISTRHGGAATPAGDAALAETGRLRLRVELRAGRSVLVQAEGQVPYAPRIGPSPPGWLSVLLVQTIAGPLAGDRVSIEVEVGPGAALELTANAATVALPASAPAHQALTIMLGQGARLSWLPQPLILAAGCDLVSTVSLSLAAGAAAFTREVLILGRHGEAPGRYQATLRCEQEGRPLLHDAVRIDPDGAGRASAAVLAGARAYASLCLLGLAPQGGIDPDELALAGGGRVLRALGPDAATLATRIAGPEAAYLAVLANHGRPG